MLHLYKHMWHTWVELFFFSKNKMFISKKNMCQARTMSSHQNDSKETSYSALSPLTTEAFFPS